MSGYGSKKPAKSGYGNAKGGNMSKPSKKAKRGGKAC